jgi:uncharacterized protein (TIGR02757 family)
MDWSHSELEDFLNEKVKKYNNPNFIETDPISIPHQFSKKQDIEISAFITSVISWGQRKTILQNANKLIQWMDHSPYQFIKDYTAKDLLVFKKFVHRTFNGEDCVYFIEQFQRIYQENEDLEQYFLKFVSNGEIMNAISLFKADFMKNNLQNRTLKHLPDPRKNSAAKRFNMFLRWMARKDNCGVDFGIWINVNPAHLMIPLDIHSGRTARELGILNRKQDDRISVELLTQKLKEFDPLDPIKYDFALYGFGVFER